jgi:hypothetical protein
VTIVSDDPPLKVLVRRPSKIRTGIHGRSVWADPVDSAELELVSTQTLKQILASDKRDSLKSIENLAATVNDGVLARDPATGMFKIIDDVELQQIIANEKGLPKLSRPTDVTLEPLHDYTDADHLSLVSTQALRRVLKPDATEKEQKPGKPETGFNPYNHS